MGNLLPWITTSSSCPLPLLLLLRASCFLLLASLPPRLLTPPLEISASRKCLPLSPVRQINQIVARSVACAGLIYTSKQRRRERERERGEVRTLVGCVHKPQVYILSLFFSLSVSVQCAARRGYSASFASPPIRAWVRKHRYRATEKFHLSREANRVVLELRPGKLDAFSGCCTAAAARNRRRAIGSIKINKRLLPACVSRPRC